MENYLYSFLHEDGLLVAIGGDDIDEYIRKTNESAEFLGKEPVGYMPYRQVLGNFLNELGARRGFFNTIGRPEFPKWANVTTKEFIYTKSDEPQGANAGTNAGDYVKFTGWYGFFRADNKDDLQKLPGSFLRHIESYAKIRQE